MNAPSQNSEAPESSSHESHGALMARLYFEHNQALVRFLMTRVESEAEARDVAQEAYVKLLQLEARGAVSFISAYLFKIAANIAVDRSRRRGVRRRMDGELARAQVDAVAPEPGSVLAARESLELVERYLEELPLKCRQVFYLHRLHELSPPEIGQRLGIKPRMVHKHLVRAMVHLRTRFAAAESGKETDNDF